MAIPRNLANIAPHVNASSTELVVNDGGANLDFRVEGDTNANLLVADAGAEKVGFGTNTFNTNGGVIQVSNGISFPATQSACSDANTLDDYEEGTWTVTATCTTSGTITLNGSVNTGRYTKIGNRVLFSFRVDVSSVSSPTGGLRINLPFPSANPSPAESGRSVVSNFIYNSVGTNISNFSSFIIQNTSEVYVTIGTSTTGSDTAANQMKAGTEIHLAGQYIAA